MSRAPFVPLIVLLVASCGTPSLTARREAARPAIDALKNGTFKRALKEAEAVLAEDAENPFGNTARAVGRFQQAMDQLVVDGAAIVAGAVAMRSFNHRYARSAIDSLTGALKLVDADLAVASRSEGFSLELCLACWERDWNHSGEFDDFDRKLLQIEVDADGKPIPENDPRRMPTIRFDHGDIFWARAFMSFIRATIEISTAYRWSDVDAIVRSASSGEEPEKVVIKLDGIQHIQEARRLILAGLDFSDRAREAYLQEADDDREWIPNPRQKSHPLPLPVDEALYETWEGVIGDIRRLLTSEEGLSVAELMRLGDAKWEDPPQGFIDIGKMLSKPKDITINVKRLEALDSPRDPTRAELEGVLEEVLGEYYNKQMKSSPLIGRLGRMKSELDRGEDELERKLRYLIWIN